MNLNTEPSSHSNNLILKLTKQNALLTADINEWKKSFENLSTEVVNLKAANTILQENISKLYIAAKFDKERRDHKISELEKQIDDLLFNQFKSDNDKSKPVDIFNKEEITNNVNNQRKETDASSNNETIEMYSNSKILVESLLKNRSVDLLYEQLKGNICQPKYELNEQIKDIVNGSGKKTDNSSSSRNKTHLLSTKTLNSTSSGSTLLAGNFVCDQSKSCNSKAKDISNKQIKDDNKRKNDNRSSNKRKNRAYSQNMLGRSPPRNKSNYSDTRKFEQKTAQPKHKTAPRAYTNSPQRRRTTNVNLQTREPKKWKDMQMYDSLRFNSSAKRKAITIQKEKPQESHNIKAHEESETFHNFNLNFDRSISPECPF